MGIDQSHCPFIHIHGTSLNIIADVNTSHQRPAFETVKPMGVQMCETLSPYSLQFLAAHSDNQARPLSHFVLTELIVAVTLYFW